MDDPKLVLIDGHSLAFRAFHALPPTLTAPGGELTNAVFGFTSMLLNVLREQQPDYIAVAFDVGRTFRDDLYAEYKGHRKRMPDELRSQVERIKQVVQALNIPIFTADGYEADDVLATLARQAARQGVDSLIVTGDRDILQVVDDDIRVLTSGRQFSDTIIYTPETVNAKYGLRPDQLVDLKALIGDKSDNIPGVPGIGEKGATNLLQQFETLDNIYKHVSEVKPDRTRAALQEGKDSAELSQKLGRIITDVPIQLDLPACRTRDYDRAQVVDLFQELAFRSLLSRLPEPAGVETVAEGDTRSSVVSDSQMALFGSEDTATILPALPFVPSASSAPELAGEARLVSDMETLRETAADLQNAPMLAFDTETTGTDPHSAEMVGLAVAWGPAAAQAAYIALKHPDVTGLSWETVRSALQPAFARSGVDMVAHNASYDLAMLDRYGLRIGGRLVDTMVSAFLLDPGSRELGLKDQVFTRLKTEMTPITELIGTGRDQITMDQVPAAQVTQYAGADAAMTLGLAQILLPELDEKGLSPLFRDIEMPLVPVLVAMEAAGIRLDVPYLRSMSKDMTARLHEIERDIQQIAGYAFNVNSTQQLSDVLFGKLGLPTEGMRKTKAGTYSTSADVLESLRGRHEIVDLILEQRQLSKLVSTYVDALPEMVNPRTGRLHTSFNQCGAETGRISSSAPNLQNIPIRTEAGREIRRAFVADDGWLLLSADYSQVELRILAHISEDEYLLAAFARGEDIHASAASKIYGIPLSQVSKEQRDVAKMMNFATSYGVSAFGLAQRTGLSQSDAQQFMERYFATYPGVKKYLDATRAAARDKGYVETLLGRRRFFPILRANLSGQQAYNLRQAAERAAINHPIQGTAADIIKIAMVNLYRALLDGGFRARMVLQVHDELVLETPEQELDAVARLVASTMENAFELKAALKVDLEAGPNWYEQSSIDSFTRGDLRRG
jgi:DNA polymerase-1